MLLTESIQSVLVDLDEIDVAAAANFIGVARATRPDVSIVAAIRAKSDSERTLLAAVRSGVDGLVFREAADFAERLVATIADSAARRSVTPKASRPTPSIHPIATAVFGAVTASWSRRPTVKSVASLLRCSPRELERRFVTAALPAPRLLVTLARWTPVIWLLAHGASTVSVASALGFDSTRALNRAARRELDIGHQALHSISTGEAMIRCLERAFPVDPPKRSRELAPPRRISVAAILHDEL